VNYHLKVVLEAFVTGLGSQAEIMSDITDSLADFHPPLNSTPSSESLSSCGDGFVGENISDSSIGWWGWRRQQDYLTQC
jgi:hypothetical protein